MTQEQLKLHVEKYAFYPIEIQGSITNELWKRYVRPPEELLPQRRKTKTVDDLEPEVRDLIKRAMREFDKNE